MDSIRWLRAVKHHPKTSVYNLTPITPPLWIETRSATETVSYHVLAPSAVKGHNWEFLCKGNPFQTHHDDHDLRTTVPIPLGNSLIKSFGDFQRPSASAYKIRACEPTTSLFLCPLIHWSYLHLLLNFNRCSFAISSRTAQAIASVFAKSSGFPNANLGQTQNQNTWDPWCLERSLDTWSRYDFRPWYQHRSGSFE
jgi:hypothetical protein